ncbi:MAG: Virginiamycin B lyase [Firmicutes bacterium]|nr:Virginiamycin B lyase [Bacillota bacterium]
MGMDKKTRTFLLAMVAVLVAVVGYASTFPAVREQGPAVNRFRRTLELPLQVASVVDGLADNQLGWPGPVAIAGDRLFVVDHLATESIIKVFSLTGEFKHGFGAMGRGGLSSVKDITLDPAGNVVVLDGAPAILVYDQEGQLIKRIDLAHYEARFTLPWANSILATGAEYYILSLDRLVRLDRRGRVLGRYTGREDGLFLGVAASEFPMGPSGLVSWQGATWVADSVHGRLLRLGERGEFDAVFPLPEVEGIRPYPTSMAVGPDDNLLVVDAARQVLVALSSEGTKLWEQRFHQPLENQRGVDVADIVVGPEGRLYVSNFLTGRVERFGLSSGRLSARQEVLAAKAEFIFPRDLAIIGNALYILNSPAGKEGARQIYRHDLTTGVGGQFVSLGLDGAIRLAAGSDLLYVLTTSQVLIFNTKGELDEVVGVDSGEWGGFGVINLFGLDQGPQGMAVDGEGRLWVSDTFRQRLLLFTAGGKFLQEIALAREIWPTSVAFAPDNTILVLNSFVGQVVRLDSKGVQLAVYGQGGSRLGQLGVVEDMGFLGGAMDLLVDGEGAFYVVDTVNNRVQKFSPQGTPLLAQGNFGSSVGDVNRPQALIPLAGQEVFLLADTNNHRIKFVQFR